MAPIHFQPDVKYRTKLYLIAGLGGVLSLLLAGTLGLAIGAREGGPAGALTGLLISLLANVLWWVPVLLLVTPYYRSLHYEIHEDEVIVRAGVITKSVKHVPFRTVTNLKVMQGPFDRLFGIGTLNIQTAGMSGQTGAEESLQGLPNFQEVYDQVAVALRRFRGSMAPTQAEEEIVTGEPTMEALLSEVRAIRRAMTQRG